MPKPKKIATKTTKAPAKLKKKNDENEEDKLEFPHIDKPITKSIIQSLDNLIWNRMCLRVYCTNQVRKSVVKKYVSSFQAMQTSERSTYLHTFQRRITSLAWHKNRPFLLAAGDKFGNMIIAQQDPEERWSNRHFRILSQVDGGGAGCSLTALKFHENESSTIFRASLDGTVAKYDLETLTNSHVYHNTEKWEVWLTAMDVSTPTNTILTGDNKGNAFLFTLNGERVSQAKLHSSKILHCEFNPKLPYLIATSALDTSAKQNHVKLWDLRKLKEGAEPLVALGHNSGVNVAHFNPLDGSRLLTSDQFDEVRVYQGPLWNRTQLIKQGHRQFQHITPIKASWHPLNDTIVIGFYPPKDTEAARTIQFYDADSGELIHELYPPESCLVSLNEFNSTGEILASGMGSKLITWKSNYGSQEKESCNENYQESTNITGKMRNALRGTANRAHASDSEEDDDPKLKRKKNAGSAARKRQTNQTEKKSASKRGKNK